MISTLAKRLVNDREPEPQRRSLGKRGDLILCVDLFLSIIHLNFYKLILTQKQTRTNETTFCISLSLGGTVLVSQTKKINDIDKDTTEKACL